MKNDFTQGTHLEQRQQDVDAFWEAMDKTDLELCRGRPLSRTAQAMFDLGVSALRPPTQEELAEAFKDVPLFAPSKIDLRRMSDEAGELTTEAQRLIPPPNYRIE